GFKQLNVDATANKGESPEEKARLVRYQALSKELQEREWLLTAQHKDDQAETLLLQLLRGAGVFGLSAMPERKMLAKGELHRPLLKVDREQIHQIALEYELNWSEDPSNQNLHVPRNYLRKKVIPLLKTFWPETTTMMDRSAGWLAETAKLATEIAEQDFKAAECRYQSLSIKILNQLSLQRQKNLIRYWFHHFALQRPGNEKLDLIIQQIINARDDANPQLDWQGISLRRYKEHLYMTPLLRDPDSDWQKPWDGMSSLELPSKGGILKVSMSSGKGLSCRYQEQEQELILKLRQGGERCHPTTRGHSQSLKHLFKEYEVPPWLRNRWPLLYCDGKIIAVPGLFICKGYEAKSSEEGLVFSVDFQSLHSPVNAGNTKT
ncbi:MAG: tRNA lysidine(34) synthetase TilS, partial [Gammaproteobacteria bacterium]|nr:tRNA lysidine(34) synthetase TilS [Gammaproteobacteria bacterium]